MKIEKINDNKLKIVLTKQDLLDKNIDIHQLNPNSMESQDLFFDLLQEIEVYYDFDLGNSQILLEGVSTSNGNMILTITKTDDTLSLHQPKLIVKKKKNDKNINEFVYKFESLDNFMVFSELFPKLPKKYINTLYKYNEEYYLIVNCFNQPTDIYKKFLLLLSDHAQIAPSTIYKNRLVEFGDLIIKNYAIQKINNQN